MRRWIRIGAALFVFFLVALAAAIATRSLWLPERFAVNVPIASIVGGGETPDDVPESLLRSLRLPPGFKLTVFASRITNPRFLRVTPEGDLFVSQPRAGNVLFLSDPKGDGRLKGIRVLEGLDRPHGLALHNGYLYVAEMTAIGRIGLEATGRNVATYERVITGLPGGGNHWTRTIDFGPDGHLYVSVGSSCNVCVEEDSRRAAILRYDPKTWQGSVFASGLRNSVGFAWRTLTEGSSTRHELFATDNGRDLLGNNFPPCELNRVVENGFYGWPFANGSRVPDPDLGAGREKEIASSIPPVHPFPAHNAPLGITFLEAAATPAPYMGAALVALHGSWNRTTKDGYKVVSLHWDAQGTITQRDFLTGFLDGETVLGRPVDVAQGADGAIYISDDFAGAIYRVTWQGEGSAPTTGATASGPAPAPSGSRVTQVQDEGAAARGLAVWMENQCDMCHDPALAGKDPDMPIRVLKDLGARFDVGKMVTYLKAPQPPMPLFEMSDQQRLDLSNYVLKRFQ